MIAGRLSETPAACLPLRGMMMTIAATWQNEDIFERSFKEYTACMQDVLRIAEGMLHTPEGTPAEFNVKLGSIPPQTWSIERNLFSTLFQSVYHLLKIQPERRLLYGKLNHLFRIWVTSADNLLDNEDKIVVPVAIGGSSRVMRQVICIMLADRIMEELTSAATRQGAMRDDQACLLRSKSLQILLPSAAEEASEENGITQRPDREYVLNTIHRLKTGLLFHIPFLGPDHIEEGLDKEVLSLCKDGLMSFGLGCQILDDIRDMAKDFVEARHSYVLSDIYRGHAHYVQKLRRMQADLPIDANIYDQFPDVVNPAATRACGLLQGGLLSLGKAGLCIGTDEAHAISLGMVETLGVGGLVQCLTL
jgi:hypothetical protein